MFRRFVPVAVLSLASFVPAQFTAFEHPDGTTHWYLGVAAPLGITWDAAHLAAPRAGGYLATVMSREENSAVFNAINRPSFWSSTVGPWIGAVQPTGSTEPAGGWKWVEYEEFGFASWAVGKPDNANDADRIRYGGAAITDTWVDAPAGSQAFGYVIEFSGAMARHTVGLMRDDQGADAGYTLICPRLRGETFLIDMRGRVVNKWTSQFEVGMSTYLLPGGGLLRCGFARNPIFIAGGSGGIVERFAWDGTLEWQYRVSDSQECHHHDIELLPNGNVLMIVWEARTQAECIAAGRDPSQVSADGLWPEKIIEVMPQGRFGGQVVWEWRSWDHLIQDFDAARSDYGIVADHPERIDINYPAGSSSPDWMHANAIDYNPQLDQVMISLRAFSEIWVIDHSTTTAQARGRTGGRYGKGGDLLYRWGNPAAYRSTAPQTLYRQHDSRWIAPGLPGAGNITVFNNGESPNRTHSSVDEIVPPLDASGNYQRAAGQAWGPPAPTWSYTAPTRTDFYSQFVSGAERLPNGNTIICHGMGGRSFEVTPQGTTVWAYTAPFRVSSLLAQGSESGTGQNLLFRSPRYFATGPELSGQKLTPGEPIEINESALLVEGSLVEHRAKPGEDVHLSLRAAKLKGRLYLVATAASTGFIAIDTRWVRIGLDPILYASLSQTAPEVFRGYLGWLDAAGRAQAVVRLPNDRSLVGMRFYNTFVVAEPPAPSETGFISNTVSFVIE